MAYLPELHFCCRCRVYLGPDDGDGICPECDHIDPCAKCGVECVKDEEDDLCVSCGGPAPIAEPAKVR